MVLAFLLVFFNLLCALIGCIVVCNLLNLGRKRLRQGFPNMFQTFTLQLFKMISNNAAVETCVEGSP